MILGLRKAAEYMTAKGRRTTAQGLHSILRSRRHRGVGKRRLGRWLFEPADLDRLLAEVRPYRRREGVTDRPGPASTGTSPRSG